MIWPAIFAVLSPFFWGVMNIIDKYVLVKKVRKPASFIPVFGLVHLIAGIVIASFLDWSKVFPGDFFFPALAGILFGCQGYFYVFVMKTEDASHVIGLAYAYPLLLALLSFVFLREIIPLQGYIGVGIVIAGIVLLSFRFKKVKLAHAGRIIIWLIFLIALTEFFVKVASGKISGWQGLSINSFAVGITLLFALLNRKVRANFGSELKNIPWAFFSEIFTLFGTGTLYFAMAGLPATVVSSVGATQPLIVLFLERITERMTGKLTKDHALLPKLGAISLIVIGIALLYFSGVV